MISRAGAIDKRFLRRLYVKLALFLLVFGIPLATYAGVFSFFSDFWKKQTGASVAETFNSQNIPLLQAVSNIDPSPARGGGDITIVDDTALLAETGPAGTEADLLEGQQNGQISIYIVRKGDTLSGISKMFNVSVNTIAWANSLKSTTLREGQTLLILPISGIQYTVKKGDTIKAIVSKYKADLDEVVQYNNLGDNLVLKEGQVVIIPDADLAYTFFSGSSSGSNPFRGGSGPNYDWYYMKPVEGRISQGLHGYNGVDIAAPLKTPVVASAGGTVIVSRPTGWNGGYGLYLVIQHGNGTQTLYSHLNQIIINEGSVVEKGQVIGYVGSTGRSTGSHLHFEVRGAHNPFVK